MILSRSLDSVRRGLAESARLERQITTGRRYERPSDAPVDVRSILELDADLRAGEQYGRNIEAARARLAISDATLETVTNLLARARELAIQHGSDTSNAAGRLAAQAEVAELRNSVVQLANRTYNGAYVFGGAYADRPPLDAAGALDPTFPARGAPQYEIGDGVLAFAAHDAGQMFIDTDVIGSLDALDVALGAVDRAAIQSAAGQLSDAIESVQRLVAEVGARQVRLDTAQSRQEIVDQTTQTRVSQLADAPIEEAVTTLAAVQAAYQASLLTTTRLLETSLVNYLR